MSQVLIAEQNAAVQDRLSRLFELARFQVRLANDGVEMMRLLREGLPEVLVINREFPEVLDIVRRIQGLKASAKIILLTEEALPDDSEENNWVDVCWCKPVDYSEAREFIRRLNREPANV